MTNSELSHLLILLIGLFFGDEIWLRKANAHGLVVKRVQNKNLPYATFKHTCRDNTKWSFNPKCDSYFFTPWQINTQSQVNKVKKAFKNPNLEKAIWPVFSKSAKFSTLEDAWKKGWFWTKRQDRRLSTPSKVCGYTVPPANWEDIPEDDTITVLLKYGHGGYQEFRINGEKIDPVSVAKSYKKGEFVPYFDLTSGGLYGNIHSTKFLNSFKFPKNTFKDKCKKGCRFEWKWLKTYDNTRKGRTRYRSELYQNCVWMKSDNKNSKIKKKSGPVFNI
mmetsp:Transcript_26531/g.36675  ORF Transcript_26531/g.36675 Transcript_26531/m.36675 type:complete len:276 (-) Transcript_26531:49-876(-)